jgi:hypothetical protein
MTRIPKNTEETWLLEIVATHPQPTVRLVDTREMVLAQSQYATLSHCWGLKQPTKLLSSNLDVFCEGIPWVPMPQTFRDSISLALRLGINYIWIDALCIIQDDATDWATQAGIMMWTHANSTINMAAADSSDSEGGLFRTRNPISLQWFHVPLQPATLECPQSGGFVVHGVDSWAHVNAVHRSKVNSRAWVEQELFLAPRTVYFCHDQVYWECLELITAEGVPQGFHLEESKGD